MGKPSGKHMHSSRSSVKKKPTERIGPESVALKRGNGGAKTGGMPGGSFWRILCEERIVGRVFINYDTEAGRAEVQIFINQKNQGRGIGRIAYRKACDESGYSVVYAFMRKSNIASIRAAETAGFERAPSENNQVTMLWHRK